MSAKSFIYILFILFGCYSCIINEPSKISTDYESLFKHHCLTCHAVINPNNSQGGITFKSIFSNSDSVSQKLQNAKLSHRGFNFKIEVLDTLIQQGYNANSNVY